jgi:hypothetical protein
MATGLNATPRKLNVLWHFLAAFLLAAIVYSSVFFIDHQLRTRRGPWEVTFTAQPGDPPRLTINQAGLGLSNVHIEFPGEVADTVQEKVRFHSPEQPVPLGRVVYEDLTYLPGVVTLELFGHEIELLPRVLYLNRQAQPWRSDVTIPLLPEDRLPILEEPRPKKRRYSSN